MLLPPQYLHPPLIINPHQPRCAGNAIIILPVLYNIVCIINDDLVYHTVYRRRGLAAEICGGRDDGASESFYEGFAKRIGSDADGYAAIGIDGIGGEAERIIVYDGGG